VVFGTGGEAGHLNPATFGHARALHVNNKTKKSEHPSIGAKRYTKLLTRQAFLLSFAASCSAGRRAGQLDHNPHKPRPVFDPKNVRISTRKSVSGKLLT
jgi:hypothetical protein